MGNNRIGSSLLIINVKFLTLTQREGVYIPYSPFSFCLYEVERSSELQMPIAPQPCKRQAP